MKILFCTTSYPRFIGDGTAPFIKSIAENLAGLGNQVLVLAPFDQAVSPMPSDGVILKRFRYTLKDSWHIMGHGRSLEADVKLRPAVFFILPFFISATLLQILKNILFFKPDLLYAHWVIPSGVLITFFSKLFKIPMIISLHGSDMYVARQNIFFRLAAKLAFRQSVLVTACSPDLLDAALEIGSPKRTILLPYGVDPEKFSQTTLNQTTRTDLGFRDDEIILFSIGRLVYKKGFKYLIDAFSTIQADLPNLRLIIGGTGLLKDELSLQIQSLGLKDKVSLIGQISWDSVPEWLLAADIFVLPSIRDHKGNVDGLPNVLLEAMACGKPIIATDIGGVKMVLENEINGIIIPQQDVASLSKAISRLVADPSLRDRLGKNARQTAVASLSWSYISNILDKAIREALRIK